MKECPFCRIASGEDHRYHIWEDDRFTAFLDRQPLNAGHLLIIPKNHADSIYDMSIADYNGLFERARRLEPVLRRVSGAIRIGLVVEGLGVRHAHLHVVPLHGRRELDPDRVKVAKPEALDHMSGLIRQEVTKSHEHARSSDN
ncbi:MAG: HIT family protein [Candidatus Kerfeldbacteria bacterium]|nr:HIT family protein [Candidatus Kerfeldbacteria bacterium]